MFDLTNPIFSDEEKACEHLEAQRWPNGAICPFCKKQKGVHALPAESMMSKPSKKNPVSKPTPGWYHCRACRKKFTVCTDTVMERSHVPLTKWLFAFRLMAASKNGMSAHQLGCMLRVQYKTAWFLEMRIRDAMTLADETSGPICRRQQGCRERRNLRWRQGSECAQVQAGPEEARRCDAP
jgi:transposase-like protein